MAGNRADGSDAAGIRRLGALFAEEPDRLSRLSFEVAGLYFDWSKTPLDAPRIEQGVTRADPLGFAAGPEHPAPGPELFQSDAEPGDALGVDDEDGFAVGDLDQVVGLVGDEHGAVDGEDGEGLGHAGDGERGVAFAVELAEGLSELVGCHGGKEALGTGHQALGKAGLALVVAGA